MRRITCALSQRMWAIDGLLDEISPIGGQGAPVTYTGTARLGIDTANAGGSFTYSGVIPNQATSLGITKLGSGILVLDQANTHTGATFTNFGTLELRNAGAGLTQTLGAMNFNQSEGTLISNNAGTGTLSTTFVSAGRTNGGTGNIIIQGGTNGVDNLINVTGAQGFINVGTFFNGADYAARNAVDGYVRALTYGTDPNAAAVDAITADNHVKLTSTPAGQDAVALLSLNLAGSGVSWTSNGILAVPGILKSGGGLQSTLSGTANTCTGTTRVQSGTLVMGASNLFGDTSALVIDNATLDAATFTDTLGTLDVNTDKPAINLGTGAALAFADSSAVSWAGGVLKLTGSFVSGASLRFGTTNAGLTTTQLGLISAAGFANFGLDADGFLTATPIGGDSAYDTWATTNAPTGDPDEDFDGEGVSNAVEFVLGGTAATDDLDSLPTLDASGGNLTFSFERDQDSIDPGTTVTIEVSTDLVNWNAGLSPYAVPDAATGVVNPGVTVVKDLPSGFDTVTLTLPQTPDPKKFARLRVVIAP